MALNQPARVVHRHLSTPTGLGELKLVKLSSRATMAITALIVIGFGDYLLWQRLVSRGAEANGAALVAVIFALGFLVCGYFITNPQAFEKEEPPTRI